MSFQSLVGKEKGGGRLIPALALSLVLHLILLWPSVLPGPAQSARTPLSATLRGPAEAVVAEPAAAGVPAPQAAVARRIASVAPSAPPKPLSLAAEGAPSAAVPQALTFSSGESAPAALPAQAAGAAQEGIDADGVRAYRIELARGARAHKRYPPLARERGWAGTAEVRVDVSGEGAPRRVALARSSGHDLLDREALAMLARAAADTGLPEALRGRTFAVSLPVVFDLDE